MSDFMLHTVLPVMNVITFTFAAFSYAGLTYLTATAPSLRWKGGFIAIFVVMAVVCGWFSVGYWQILTGLIDSDSAVARFRPAAWILAGGPAVSYVMLIFLQDANTSKAISLLAEAEDGDEGE